MSKARLVITAIEVEGRTPAEVIAAYGVSRSWLYELPARYRAEGDAAFEPRSRRPHSSPRAIPPRTEALATSVPLFLLLFAGVYVVMAARSTASFGGHLTHTDALYFTVTVFSTVGFGDITAKSEAARLVVTGQMIADVVIIGIAIKSIVGAARQRR